MEAEVRVSARLVNLAVLIALVLGVALYNVIPLDSDDLPAAQAALVDEPAAPAATPRAAATVPARAPGSGGFGSGVAALEQATTADQVVSSGGGGDAVDTTPPTVPPACPTDAASDAYETVADPLAAALGEALPRDNLRLLAEIAAGCSTESPATPLLGLALDIGRLVPDTGLAPLDLSAIPPVAAPELPAEVIDALAPLQPTIMEACSTIGLLGVLLAVLPGAAHVPVNGSELADLIVPATSLCAQFEG